MWHWMTLPLRRYADFSGRSRRKEYWLYTLFYFAVTILLYLVTFASFPWEAALEQPAVGGSEGQVSVSGQTVQIDGSEPLPSPLFWVGIVALGLWTVGTFVPNIAVTVRRFHDQDRSGWLYLLNLIPYVGFLIVFVFMCLEGTRGPNRYGDDPKDENTADIFE